MSDYWQQIFVQIKINIMNYSHW